MDHSLSNTELLKRRLTADQCVRRIFNAATCCCNEEMELTATVVLSKQRHLTEQELKTAWLRVHGNLDEFGEVI